MDTQRRASTTSLGHKSKRGQRNTSLVDNGGQVDRSMNSQPQAFVFVRFRHLAVVTVSLPCFAFMFCIIYSWFNHYEWVTRTHCQVWNIAPSISGLMTHQLVWLHLTQLLCSFYRQLCPTEVCVEAVYSNALCSPAAHLPTKSQPSLQSQIGRAHV